MQNQIIFIGGGETFDNREQYYKYLEERPYDPGARKKSWRDWIEWALSNDYESLAPSMPNKQYADYRSWKIWFEKLFPYLDKGKLIVVGHSLGGLFLAKYLSENTIPRKVNQLHLVAAVFDNQGLVGHETVGDFTLSPDKLQNVEGQAENIWIYHSRDDELVPFEHAEKYQKSIPKANLTEFKNRGHFIDQPAFLELLENILKLDQG